MASSASSFRSTQPDLDAITDVEYTSRHSASSSLARTLVETTPLLPSKRQNNEPRTHTLAEIKKEAWFILGYAVPIFGTQVLEYSLSFVPVIAIGHISTDALAASSLGSMTASVSGLSIIYGFTSALDSLLPQAWTSDRPQDVGLWTQRMTVLIYIIMVPIIVIWLNAEWILLKLRQEPEIAHLAGIYLRWFALSLPGQAITIISRRYFQAQGLMQIPTLITLIIAPLNALFNYLLVWGPEPIRIGFVGAPIASSVSYTLMAVISLLYAYFFVPTTAWHPINSSSFKELFKLFKLGLSGTGQIASDWWSWEFVALAASQLGPLALASQSVLLVSSSIAYQTPFSLGLATSVRVGNMLGSGQAKRAKLAAETAIGMSFITAIIQSSIFLIFRHNWARLFNNDDKVVALVASVLPLVALFQIVEGATCVTDGVLRARGMFLFGALVNVCSYYVIGIPFGIALAFWAHLGLKGLWAGLAAALFFAATASIWVVLRTDWEREVERTKERLGIDGNSDESSAVSET
ncbi:MATE efflux family protein [Ceratobasidium sp. AG-Ba]|nr:MATE efflux family protein [Ceratobasidium sp. AG-Ba]QRW10926.1 MATE efflux family protein [Ceratobasidium sp. AG-Ba]